MKKSFIYSIFCILFCLLMIGISFQSCIQKDYSKQIKLQSDSIKILKDSILILNAEREYFSNEIQSKSDTISLYKNNKLMNYDCFSAKFKLEKIQYYTDICLRKPSQKIYYFGWINRTLSN